MPSAFAWRRRGQLWSSWHSRGLPGMWGMSQQKSWPLETLRKGKCSLTGVGWVSVENDPFGGRGWRVRVLKDEGVTPPVWQLRVPRSQDLG